MNKKRHKIISAVHLILEKDGQILLLRRKDTGFQDGNYNLVAGHIDAGEPAKLAMIREAKEEAKIDIHNDQLEIIHVMHRKGEDNERVDFFMRAKSWLGEPENGELDKCDDLSWFLLDELPDNTVLYIKVALENIKRKVYYSEFGW